MIGIVPFTLVLIVPTEEKLLGKEAKLRRSRNFNLKTKDKEEAASSFRHLSEDTRALMVHWNVLNYGRVVFPLLGMLLAWTLW
jgi:hypothetical protein